MEKVIPEESFKKGKKKFSRQTQVEWQGRSEGDRRNSSARAKETEAKDGGFVWELQVLLTCGE